MCGGCTSMYLWCLVWCLIGQCFDVDLVTYLTTRYAGLDHVKS